jgi:hypothetical protein
MIYTNNAHDWVLQEVPINSTDISVEVLVEMCVLRYNSEGTWFHTMQKYNLFNRMYVIHSDSLTITEEQAREIVDGVLLNKWKNYEAPQYDEFLKDSALDSYRSLLRSLELDGKRIINLKEIYK